MVKKDNW